MIVAWLAMATASADGSDTRRVVTGAGLVVGGIGAAGTAWGLGLAASSEPVGAFEVLPASATLLILGAGTTIASSIAEGHHAHVSTVPGAVGGVALGAGVVLGVVAIASGDETVAWAGLIGGPALAFGGLCAGGVQGWVDRPWRSTSVVAVPDPRRPGLIVAGAFR
ncbi:MAG: hypothetical protein ABMB14_21945 [Myxococcota bacterium]